MKFESDIESRLLKLLAACDDNKDIAQQVSSEAKAHAQSGAMANIYDTSPGKYERTHALFNSLRSSGTSNKSGATVEVSGGVDYMTDVELGRKEGHSTAEELWEYARARDPQKPLKLGRSGRNYMIAGPILIPAASFAAWRMQQRFAEKVKAALK